MDTDNSMGIIRPKGGWGQVEEGKQGINGDRRRLGFGWQEHHACADDVL